MRARILQHVPFESPGSIAPTLRSLGASVETTRLFSGEVLPAAADVDLLVIMGGPMSVNDEAEHPWLVDEKALVAEAIVNGRAVLGVCLGAQVIASALGYPVFKNREPEIGWFPIQPTVDGEAVGLNGSGCVFHWHGETFDLPEGAIHLAESAACPNQAFEVEFDGGPARGGALLLALQFHLEATEGSVRMMYEGQREELAREAAATGSPTLAESALVGEPARYAPLRPLLDDLLDRLTAPRASFRDASGATAPRTR